MIQPDLFSIEQSVPRQGSFRFFVTGIPAPGGSKNGFAIKKGGVYTGRVAIVESAGHKNKDWRAAVAWTAVEAMRKEMVKAPLLCALRVDFHFTMPRPKHHYRSNGQLKETAPTWHVAKPDTTKLIRSSEDSLKGIAWVDDSQIAQQTGSKVYGIHAGCEITITPI